MTTTSTIVNNRHQQLVDYLISNPGSTLKELSVRFNLSVPYLSILTNTDTFKAKLEERRQEVVDPVVTANVKALWEGAAKQSLEIIQEALAAEDADVALALKVAALSNQALVAKNPVNTVLNTQFVVTLPEPSKSDADWEAEASRLVG